MAITLDNSTNTVNFDDALLRRKTSNALETPGALDVGSLKVTQSGITFPDSTVMTTAPTAGGGGISDVYNNTARYAMIDTVGQSVWCVSTSTVYAGKTWTRSGTSLTLNHTAHGHSVGERVIVRNTNVNYQVALITAVTTDTWTIACTDTGPTSGSLGAYMMGFNYAHNSQTAGAITSGTLTAPANADVQLISLRINLGANQRAATNYTFTLPNSAFNGAGDNISADTLYTPMLAVRQLTSGVLTAVGATLATFVGSNWSSFIIGAMSSVATPNTIALQF